MNEEERDYKKLYQCEWPTPEDPLPTVKLWLEQVSDMPRSREFEVGPIEVYLRQFRDQIQIGRIKVLVRHQGRGEYHRFVGWLYAEAKRIGYKSVKHENTESQELIARHQRHGLKRVPNGFGYDSYIKDLT